MTEEHEASRTLVKSPPELWAECSDAAALARHLSGSFGEIRITRLEPETAVAWEGEHASGTVRIEPSGWGTRVTLTAQTAAPRPAELAVAPAPAADHPAALAVAAQALAADHPAALPVAAEAPAAEQPAAVTVAAQAPAAERPAAETVAAQAPAADRRATAPAPRRTLRERLLVLFRRARAEPPPLVPDPEPEAPPTEPFASGPVPEPGTPDPDPAEPEPAEEQLHPSAALTAALDSLGQAHHRPFSRA
jgi:hypothetical protein